MRLGWFKPRNYRHFDLPVNEAFAKKVTRPEFVSRHSFSPLLHYTKVEKRYKKCRNTGARHIVKKERPIKYASHRDSCILSYYSRLLNDSLDVYYEDSGISDSVIAYRSLGKANYNFSAEALSFAKSHSPVTILAFDVTGFFDNLDHGLLKQRFKAILDVPELSDDWYKIFRFITRFHFVALNELKEHREFRSRFSKQSRGRIASISELKAAGVNIHPNPEIPKGYRRGIPQGTPISAAASNLYMMEFDKEARSYCDGIDALYRRYSDDILIVCKPNFARAAKTRVMKLIAKEELDIAEDKTEQTNYDANSTVEYTSKAAQYLGFTLDESGPAIRESSLSRQWRKMRRAIRRTRRTAEARIAAGQSDKVYTKRLYRRFTYLKVSDENSVRAMRNFSSYGRRSAEAFGEGEKILRQVRRFERATIKELASLKRLNKQSSMK